MKVIRLDLITVTQIFAFFNSPRPSVTSAPLRFKIKTQLTLLDEPQKSRLSSPRFSKHLMPPWWNGRHCGFKIRCSQRRAGSSPAGGIFSFVAGDSSPRPFLGNPAPRLHKLLSRFSGVSDITIKLIESAPKPVNHPSSKKFRINRNPA
jgi:hypothetical protein